MPLTLSAKFKVLQNQNYYGYHITGGKLFCTSVLNSNFSLTRIVVGAKFLANGYIKCNFMCSDYELLDMESDMFNYCILSNIHLERSRLAWVRMEDCVAIGMSWKENYITGAKFIRCNFSHSKFKETEFHKCVFIDCIIQDVTLTRVSFVKCKFKNCIFTEFPEDKKGTCKFINCREEKEECF